ncbi:MAG: twin-arginine translocation signal domain-containing protein, partial [Anaerolineaceae bacterium]|nr:twin-arginine translocation signal domain-containing protein [Anaerolineaceae bacterium]
MARLLKRRDFIKLSSVAVLGAVAAACAPKPVDVEPTMAPEAPEAPKAEPTKAPEVAQPEATKAPDMPAASMEPPLLADKVKSGALPPLEERLPESPLVVDNRAAIGTYGGEMRVNSFDPVWWVSFYDCIVERMLVYSDMDTSVIVPNVLESWEVT